MLINRKTRISLVLLVLLFLALFSGAARAEQAETPSPEGDDSASALFPVPRAERLWAWMEALADQRQADGEFLSAMDLYRVTPGAEEKLAACREAYYQLGVLTMRRGDFTGAKEIFSSLGDYGDCPGLLEFCDKRLNMPEIPESKRLLTERTQIETFSGGKLYLHPQGYLYVPDCCDENTACCVYFAGGGDGDWLYRPGVYYYLEQFQPNALMLWFFESGYKNMPAKIGTAAGIVEQMAVEKGITLHDVITVGSSQGCFTALRASSMLYMDYGIPVKETILLDAGMEWMVPDRDLPSEEESRARIEVGTKLMLFEQEKAFHNEKIQELVRRGEDVYIIVCRVDDHNNISAYAYYQAVFSWGLGEMEELNPEEYTLIPFPPEDLEKYPVEPQIMLDFD